MTWATEHSQGVTLSDDTGFVLKWDEPDAQVTYVTRPAEALRPTLNIEAHIEVTGDGFKALDGTEPDVRCLIRSEHGQWLSHADFHKLERGKFSLFAPLTSNRWVDEKGRKGDSGPKQRQGFADTLKNATRIGLSFDSGITAYEKSEFALISFKVA